MIRPIRKLSPSWWTSRGKASRKAPLRDGRRFYFCHGSALFTPPSDCLQCDPAGVLTEIHIEALLVDRELADQVWEAWDTGPAQRTINSVES